MVKNITADIRYVGVNDHKIDLFEGQYIVPNGMAYNSYVIIDEKIAVMDTVDRNFTNEWLGNLKSVLEGRQPDYLVVQHMEPDHSANIMAFLKAYPRAKVISNAKAFTMMGNYFDTDFEDRKIVVKDGEAFSLGKHTLNFVFAPMVHWPEVMVTYDSFEKVLFSADGFGKFGALDVQEDWDCEARRYYIGIVGKYGAQVQALLKKAATLDIKIIAPLHGPILTKDLEHYIKQYDIWSSYGTETEGIMIAYTSVYGHTKEAVMLLADKLKELGCPKVVVNDLAREDMAECVEDAFRYGKIVLATTTYNAEIFPFMREFINHLTERNFQNRMVGLIENGSWAPLANKVMKEKLSGCKNITWCENNVTIRSALNGESLAGIDALAKELCRDYTERSEEPNHPDDLNALFKIGYGLYAITCSDGNKDNACIVNTVSQLTNNPNRIAVTINKKNFSHDVIKATGKLNVNCLSVDAPFSVFEKYGFKSGRDTDKFAGEEVLRSKNGIAVLPRYINAMMSLKAEQYLDLDTHGMFICTVSEARVMSDKETMTYNYYLENVKPRPETTGKKGWICKVCGYVYEGDELPEDYICPLCKHPASDFEPIKD